MVQTCAARRASASVWAQVCSGAQAQRARITGVPHVMPHHPGDDPALHSVCLRGEFRVVPSGPSRNAWLPKITGSTRGLGKRYSSTAVPGTAPYHGTQLLLFSSTRVPREVRAAPPPSLLAISWHNLKCQCQWLQPHSLQAPGQRQASLLMRAHATRSCARCRLRAPEVPMPTCYCSQQASPAIAIHNPWHCSWHNLNACQ